MRSGTSWWRHRVPVPVGSVAMLTAVLAAAGCSTPSTTRATEPPTTVTVLAASSLTRPLTELAAAYRAAHPTVDVQLSFGSSTTLAQQVANGAPADLAVFAGRKALAQLPAGSVTTAPQTLARNTLEIAVPAGNPGGVTSLADLRRSDLAVVLCVATAPCGAAADTVLAHAGVSAHVVSRELDVAATLTKVRLGEADAAVIYHSDVVGARGAVLGIPIPAADNVTLDYPLVRLSTNPAAAAFATYLSGPDGLATLAKAGFLPPS